jgi:hypothetical protein
MACWPNRPAGPSGPLGSAKPTGSGLGQSNRPSPAPLTLLSDSHRHLWRSGSPPPSPGHSGRLRRPSPLPPWANHSPQHPLPAPPSGIACRLLSEEIWVISPLRICRLRAPPMWCLAVLGLAEPAELAHVLVSHSARWLKHQGVMLLVWAWWRLPQAASGWPRRLCPTMPSTQAPGRLVSTPSSPLHHLLLSLSMVSDHAGQDQWAKLTELTLWCCYWMLVWFIWLWLCYIMWFSACYSTPSVSTLTDRSVVFEPCTFTRFS